MREETGGKPWEQVLHSESVPRSLPMTCLSVAVMNERFNHGTIGHSQWVQAGWLFLLEYTPI